MAERRLRNSWRRRTSLTVRILAVNIIALGLMAGSLFYLDSYRKQLFEERFKLARAEAEIAAAGLAGAAPAERTVVIRAIGTRQNLRLRLYDPSGALAIRPGVIKSRNQLMDAAYSDDVFVDDRTIDSHIKRLRRKFRSADRDFSGIETLYGAGYSFTDG